MSSASQIAVRNEDRSAIAVLVYPRKIGIKDNKTGHFWKPGNEFGTTSDPACAVFFQLVAGANAEAQRRGCKKFLVDLCAEIRSIAKQNCFVVYYPGDRKWVGEKTLVSKPELAKTFPGTNAGKGAAYGFAKGVWGFDEIFDYT